MTYLEAYRLCLSPDELLEKIKKDTMTALILNLDRIKPIEEAMNIVAKERGWDLTDEF